MNASEEQLLEALTDEGGKHVGGLLGDLCVCVCVCVCVYVCVNILCIQVKRLQHLTKINSEAVLVHLLEP